MIVAAVLPQMAVVGGAVLVILGLGGFAQALLRTPVVPDADLLVRMALASGGAAAGLATPVGALAGIVGGLRRLREEGAWLGLRAAGFGGRASLRPIAGIAAIAVVTALALSHVGEPLARAALRDARVAAAVRVRPVEGRTLAVGPWAIAVEEGALQFAGSGTIGSARTWSVQPAVAGVLVQLGPGRARALDGSFDARFSGLEMPVALASGGKVHPSERATPDLVRHIAGSTPAGRDAYERWILWKRTLLPLCLVPLGVAAIPLGLGRRPVLAITGAQVFTVWGVMRVADQWIGAVGPAGAALMVGAVAMAWPIAAWRRWRDA